MAARILIWDIETSPIISYNWGIYDQNAIKVIADWQILMFAYKWLDEKKVHIVAQDDFKDYKPGVNNDKNVVIEIRKLLDEADIVVAHNGNAFDQKKAQARMMIHGLTPPSPYQQVDTKLAIKRVAAHTSNKLSDLARSLEITQKLDPGGINTWIGCMNGDKKAWKRMKKYNKYDVIVLEELYLKILPWITNHPSVNNIESKTDSCPKCGHGPMQSRGYQYGKTTSYRRYQCQSCGGWSRSRLAEYKQAEERMKYA